MCPWRRAWCCSSGGAGAGDSLFAGVAASLQECIGVGDLQDAAYCFAFVGRALIECLADFVAYVITQVGGAVLGAVSLKHPSADVRARHVLLKLRPQRLFVGVAVTALNAVDDAAGDQLTYEVRSAFGQGLIEEGGFPTLG